MSILNLFIPLTISPLFLLHLSESESLDLMTIILRSAEGVPLDPQTYQRIQRASQAYEQYKAFRDSLEDPESNQGPTNDDAWLFEDLHVYMRLLRRSRDKQQLIELIFEVLTLSFIYLFIDCSHAFGSPSF